MRRALPRRFPLRRALLAACALLAGYGIYDVYEERELTGRVVSIPDGDTVYLEQRGVKHKIRLSQIDAPETRHGKKSGQPFGEAAQQSLAQLIGEGAVRATCRREKDAYGRNLCTLWRGEVDLNREQVKRGMAWVYRDYAYRFPYYLSEWEARQKRLGLWKQDNPQAPWDWRHGRS